MNFPFKQQPLVVTSIGVKAGVAYWRLTEPLLFCNAGAYGLEVTVPKGFVTDFASVPRALWWLYPPSGQWARAAVVHDFLYQQADVSRFLADAIFREAMFQLGVPWYRRLPIYYAVRLFGGLCRRIVSTKSEAPNTKPR